MHRGEVGQVALHDLRPKPTQIFSAFILPADHGAHLMSFGEQHCGEVAANTTDSAGRSRHENRAIMCRFHRHIDYLFCCVKVYMHTLKYRAIRMLLLSSGLPFRRH